MQSIYSNTLLKLLTHIQTIEDGVDWLHGLEERDDWVLVGFAPGIFADMWFQVKVRISVKH